MNAGFKIGPLQGNQIERAYVVMQAAMPSLTFAAWRSVVDNVFQRHLFTAATDLGGYVRGLCLSRIESHPVAGRLCDVPIFIVISPVEEDQIAKELFAFIKRQAINARCSHLRIWALTADNWNLLGDEAFRNRWDHGLVYRLESGPINPASR